MVSRRGLNARRPDPRPISQQQKPQIQPDRSRGGGFTGAGTGGKQPDRSKIGKPPRTGGKQPDRTRPILTRGRERDDIHIRPPIQTKFRKGDKRPFMPRVIDDTIRITQQATQQQPRQIVTINGHKPKLRPQIKLTKNADRLIQAQKFNREAITKGKSFSGSTVAQISNRATQSKKGNSEVARAEAQRRKQERIDQFDFGTNIDNPPQRSDTQKVSKGQIISAKAKTKPQGFGFNFGNEVSSFVQHFPQSKIGQGVGKVQGGLQQAGEGIFDIVEEVIPEQVSEFGGKAFEQAKEFNPLFVLGGKVADTVNNPENFLGNFFGETKTVTRASSIPKKIRKPLPPRKPVAKKTKTKKRNRR